MAQVLEFKLPDLGVIGSNVLAMAPTPVMKNLF